MCNVRNSVWFFLHSILYGHFVSGSCPSALLIFELSTTNGSNVNAEWISTSQSYSQQSVETLSILHSGYFPELPAQVEFCGSQNFVYIKGHPQQAEVAQGVPGRLRPRIFLMFGTTRVVGRQPYASAAFTPREISGTHFQRLSRFQGTWFRR